MVVQRTEVLSAESFLSGATIRNIVELLKAMMAKSGGVSLLDSLLRGRTPVITNWRQMVGSVAESTPSSNGSVGSSDLILILGSSVLSQIFFSVDVAVVRNPVKVRMMEKLTAVDSARRVPLGAVDLRVAPCQAELADAEGVGVLLSKKNSGFSKLLAV